MDADETRFASWLTVLRNPAVMPDEKEVATAELAKMFMGSRRGEQLAGERVAHLESRALAQALRIETLEKEQASLQTMRRAVAEALIASSPHGVLLIESPPSKRSDTPPTLSVIDGGL